ncbi:hypothetical protein, partial [Campylobacter troglodytis]|uniref:hypothetical protein n=1 Tax=Campylobacter troglodytis TaxID=654363 RepID=UPI001C8E31DD
MPRQIKLRVNDKENKNYAIRGLKDSLKLYIEKLKDNYEIINCVKECEEGLYEFIIEDTIYEKYLFNKVFIGLSQIARGVINTTKKNTATLANTSTVSNTINTNTATLENTSDASINTSTAKINNTSLSSTNTINNTNSINSTNTTNKAPISTINTNTTSNTLSTNSANTANSTQINSTNNTEERTYNKGFVSLFNKLYQINTLATMCDCEFIPCELSPMKKALNIGLIKAYKKNKEGKFIDDKDSLSNSQNEIYTIDTEQEIMLKAFVYEEQK